MSIRASKTHTAINTGYGMPRSKSKHPEYLFQPPYSTPKTKVASRGGKALFKGS